MSAEPQENRSTKIRHSAAHVMAQAVLELFPEGKLAIGPAIEDGFYYDFDLPRPLTPDDLTKVEARMKAIISEAYPFIQSEVSVAEALSLFTNQPYKLDLIKEILANHGEPVSGAAGTELKLSLYTHSSFTDLCKGPHLASTAEIDPEAVKLLNVAGAYWRGDERNPMLQRIYGAAFQTPAELQGYLERRAEIEKRDHRLLGKQLDLFSVQPELGGGLVLWHPKGAMLRHLVEEFCKNEHLRGGYSLVVSPHIGRANLWETSGHLTWYKENMYSSMDIEGQDYYLKPMNCPFHILIYRNARRSYRALPVRYAEWGTVYRFERGGVLHGLLRVRGFTQDDAHIFCRPDQMPGEIDRVLNFCLYILRSFGFDEFQAYLVTRDPAKSAGDSLRWDEATRALQEALQRAQLPFAIDEGGAAFYGPKIDIKIKDALGREWQLSTIQFDFNLPERFKMTYTGEDGQEHQPYMIHRALLGSMERFIGVLIEHYEGAFPVWLAPVQAVIIPIADRHLAYAQQVESMLSLKGIRVEVDASSNRMQAKIREAQNQKIVYMLVVGDREVEEGKINLRLRHGEVMGALSVEEICAYIEDVVRRKALI